MKTIVKRIGHIKETSNKGILIRIFHYVHVYMLVMQFGIQLFNIPIMRSIGYVYYYIMNHHTHAFTHTRIHTHAWCRTSNSRWNHLHTQHMLIY